MKINVPKDWCLDAAEREGDSEIGVGYFVQPPSTSDAALLRRALVVLHHMATERTGWRYFLSRWYYSDEPLRNDAAEIVREARFGMPMPIGTHLVGDVD